MAGFDYTTVWAAHLHSKKVIVHAKRRFELVDDGPRRRVVRTKCGTDTAYVQLYDNKGNVVDAFGAGVQLAAGHALAIGAHFCRLCWPELREADR